MPLTTIPITFYLSFEQPAGVTIVPQIAGDLDDTWHYTVAPSRGDRSVGFNPRTPNAHDAVPTEPQPTTIHASVKTNATVETNATEENASLATGAAAEHSDPTAALNERLLAENRRLEDEAELLRDALLRLTAGSVDFNPRMFHLEETSAVESNGHAPAKTGATATTYAPVKTRATDPPDRIEGYQPRTSTSRKASPAETNGHAPVEPGVTNGQAPVETADPVDDDIDDDIVAPDVTGDNPTEKPLSPRHQKALVMLVGGSTIAEIARELKVDSSTVGRWMRKPSFVARYNRHVRECDHAIHRKLQTISDDALEVMAAHVNLGSLRAAVHVLKGRGFLSGQKNKFVPILEADSVAAPAPEPPSEPTPVPPFPQRESLNGHVYAGVG